MEERVKKLAVFCAHELNDLWNVGELRTVGHKIGHAHCVFCDKVEWAFGLFSADSYMTTELSTENKDDSFYLSKGSVHVTVIKT